MSRQIKTEHPTELLARLHEQQVQLDKLNIQLYTMQRQLDAKLFAADLADRIVRSLQILPYDQWPLLAQTLVREATMMNSTEKFVRSHNAFMNGLCNGPVIEVKKTYLLTVCEAKTSC